MKLALYKGTSAISRVIRFLTRSQYSHAALLFDSQSSAAATHLQLNQVASLNLPYTQVGAVIEAWNDPSAVRNTPNLLAGHDKGTPVDIFTLKEPFTIEEERRLLLWLAGELGFPYDWKGVFRFVTRRPGNLEKAWFCSELCFEALRVQGRELLGRTKAWEVPPGWIPRSPLLEYERTEVL